MRAEFLWEKCITTQASWWITLQRGLLSIMLIHYVIPTSLVHAAPIDLAKSSVRVQAAADVPMSLNQVSGTASLQDFGFGDAGDSGTIVGAASAETLGYHQAIEAPNHIPGLGLVHASASTATTPEPGVIPPHTTSGTSEASAMLDFYVALLGPGNTPIPIDIGVRGMVNVDLDSGDGRGNAFAQIRVESVATPLNGFTHTAQIAGSNRVAPDFNITERLFITPGDALRVLMDASVSASAFSVFDNALGTTISAESLVDPSFLIPFDFADRDLYSFEVSANLEQPEHPNPVPVPEPASWLLFGLGFLMLVQRSASPRGKGLERNTASNTLL